MAEIHDDSDDDAASEFPDFTPLMERAQRLLHGLPGKKLEASPLRDTPHPAEAASSFSHPLPQGERGQEANGSWSEDHEDREVERLKARVEAVQLPTDLDDLDEAMDDKMREGYSIPRFVYSYISAMKAQLRRRRRPSRAEPKTRYDAARLIGRVMGQIEIAIADYLADTYETMPNTAKPGHMIAGARMGTTIAQMGVALGQLESEGRRVKLDYEIRHASAQGESE